MFFSSLAALGVPLLEKDVVFDRLLWRCISDSLDEVSSTVDIETLSEALLDEYLS